MVFFLGQGEKVIREQCGVWYHNGHSKIGTPMWGRLVLTDRRFIFLKQRIVSYGGVLGFGRKKELRTTGVVFNLPLDCLIGATMETRTRRRRTLNKSPSFFSREKYQVLIVSLESPERIENPTFEVYHAGDWVAAMQQAVGVDYI